MASPWQDQPLRVNFGWVVADAVAWGLGFRLFWHFDTWMSRWSGVGEKWQSLDNAHTILMLHFSCFRYMHDMMLRWWWWWWWWWWWAGEGGSHVTFCQSSATCKLTCTSIHWCSAAYKLTCTSTHWCSATLNLTCTSTHWCSATCK